MKIRWKPIALTVFLASCLAGTARSDVLNVQGNTTGQFTTPIDGLSYTGTSFDVYTNAAGNAFDINLGTFSYTAPILAAGTSTFTTTITIAVPLGTSPGSASQAANVNAVAIIGLGVASFDFTNTPLPFNFVNSEGSGSFQLAIQDVIVWDLSLAEGSSQILRGNITNAVFTRVPEPGPVELLLTLLAGLGYVLKKRVALFG